MAIFKCKMCGGALEINEDITVAECEYCGSKQTLPSKKDEVITNLFNRANNLRLKNEFDKAAEVYNKILNENDDDAEAHWGLVLCKYGIEYVEDPKTYKRIPTCHRTQYTSVLSDADYLAAVENADAVSKEVYVAEAKEIAELQKSILAIVKDEKPFDVFICYKETDESGKRTVDSALANDIYYQLEKEGLRVFYAAITLEDKLGVEYEPYIFAALNSAKVMLAIGTKPEYFNAVWVKNEWSRYLGIMKTDREKMLIPCYRDMDAYDLPEEFAHLQAQDMSKIGFINDLVRGIKKVTVKEEKMVDVIKETVVTEATANIAPLLERAFIFLEDGDWSSANEYCEKVLDIDPKNAQAYLGKLMADQRVKTQENLKNCEKPFDKNNNYQKILRFGDEELKNTLIGYVEYIKNRNEEARLSDAYSRAKNRMDKAKSEDAYKEAAQFFEKIKEYKDSADLINECYEKAEAARKDAILDSGKSKMADGDIPSYNEAIKIFSSVSGWKDADEKIAECESKIAEIEAKEETERIERERKEAEDKRKAEEAIRIAKEKAAVRKKKIKKLTTIIVPAVCVIVAIVVLLNTVIIPNSKYNNAVSLMEAGSYKEALIEFRKAGDYKDSHNLIIANLDKITTRETVSAGGYHTVGLKADGTVVATGDNDEGQCDAFLWTDIIAVTAGSVHTVGLKSDGTVVAVGYNSYYRCNVSTWTDIIAISAGRTHTVGLKSDGTVVATGDNHDCKCNVSEWTDIIAVSAGEYHTVGLKADGTVVATGDNGSDQCDVSEWNDIIAVSAGREHTVGLKSDGTIVAAGDNSRNQCDVSEWNDIIAVSAKSIQTVGLKSDGTVVATGSNNHGQCDVSEWTDIVAVSSGDNHTVGLKADGTVVSTGYNYYGQCDVSSWKNIKTP